MTAVDCTGRVSINDIVRLGRARRVGADNYKNGEASTATTYTLTVVVTPSATATDDATVTIDYSST